MIRTEEGTVELRGNIPTLLAEYSTITKHMHMEISQKIGEEAAKKQMEESFELAFMNKEQFQEKFKEAMFKYMERNFKE